MAKTDRRRVGVVSITDMTREGEGVGRLDGMAIFVPGLIPGDVAEVEVIDAGKSYLRGRVVRLTSPSEGRVGDLCDGAEGCGGCPLQAASYDLQLSIKTSVVRNALSRIGSLDPGMVRPCVASPIAIGYRNRSQYSVVKLGGRVIAGFKQRRSHRISGADSCRIQPRLISDVVEAARRLIETKGVSVHSSTDGRTVHFGVHHLEVRVDSDYSQALVTIVTSDRNGADGPTYEAAQALIRESPEVVGVVVNFSLRDYGPLLGADLAVAGQPYIIDRVGHIRYKLSHRSFFQVNPYMTERLYSTALEYAGLTGEERALDVYSGVGGIALYVASHCATVVGVESVSAAVRDAQENARLNSIDNASFIAGKAEEVIPRMGSQADRFDVVFLDPPREGCDEAVIQALTLAGPSRIVYVSCDPATLARDLRRFSSLGYRCTEVQPFDMFPMTMHVECVALMSRVKNK